MAYNPNAVFISPSSISSFKSCPQAYYYSSVYKNPKTGLKVQLINPKLALGSTVHSILAQFLFRLGGLKTKDQLINIMNRFWADISGEKGGFLSQEEESKYKERALKMLEVFWANEHFRVVQPVKMPDFPKVDLGEDLILTGKLDWIEKEDDKNYHIVDFKTGEKEERNDSLQLPIYAVLASSYLKFSNIKTSYWYLDRDTDISRVDVPDLKEIVNQLKQIGLIIKNSRLTKSFRCSSGYESCWACEDLIEIVKGNRKLVAVDYNRKQEIYINKNGQDNGEDYSDDLPF